MKTKYLAVAMLAGVVGLTAVSTFAADGKSEANGVEQNRSEHKLGAYLSVLGDPAPNLLGINAAYNAADFMRITAGFGHTSTSIGTLESSLTTLGVGAKFMVPDWNFTPVGGVNFSYAMFSGNATINSLTGNTLVPYLTLGADWQAKSGFNLGFGINVAMAGVGVLPYANVGWFF